MSSEYAVQARSLGKCYSLFDRPGDRLKQLLWGRWHRYDRDFWALRDVSFDIRKGEVVGIVGRNGAGKSTLLQMVCGTLSPTSGTLAVEGRVAALLELGAGFNPDFTGLENVYMNAAILGLSRNQVSQKLDDILTFADIGDFIHQPVKTYSSGMFMRLAFAVATSVEPDILVIDEALSVGDGAFARKSFDRIMRLKDAGKTILFCSHSMYQVEALCSRALWIEAGAVRMAGNAAEVTSAYGASLNAELPGVAAPTQAPTQEAPVAVTVSAPGTGRITRIGASADGASGRELSLRSGQSDLRITIDYAVDPGLPEPSVALGIADSNGLTIASATSRNDGVVLARDERGIGSVTITFTQLPLLKGTYRVTFFLACENAVHLYEQVDNWLVLNVSQDGIEQGLVALPPPMAAMMASSAAAHVQTVRVGEQTLTVRDVQPADRSSVLALHERVFGPGATPAWFEWKYGSGADQGRSEGVGVWHEGALIAHCAGIPRRLWRAGSSIEGVQIGDVMVDPGWRGILTRRGPFFHASQRLYATRLGKLGQRPFQLGFGFPNERHMRLAVKSHLAYDGGRLHDLRWSTSDPTGQTALHWSWRWEAMAHDDPSTLDEIDRAWLAMRREGAAMTLGERDHRYVKWRYLDRPDQQYQLFRLRHVWPSRKVGIAVMRLRQPQSQWLDWIGPRKWLIAACRACRAQAAQFGAKELAAWASPLVVDALRDSAWRHNSVTACLGIPASSDLIEADVPQLNWWLMGGDTDFL